MAAVWGCVVEYWRGIDGVVSDGGSDCSYCAVYVCVRVW